MAGRGESSEFVEALARGLDVLTAFSDIHPSMTLSGVAAATGLARPTARRLLLTLVELGFVRQSGSSFELTPRVLDLGYAHLSSLGLWDAARPRMEDLVRQTNESSSMTELDGSDIVYVARVAVPKLIALRVEIGTRFPAVVTSQGKVLLAALSDEELKRRLDLPTRSAVQIKGPDRDALRQELASVRAQGWALADEELAPGVRSVAAPVRDRDGVVRAALNVTVHAAETSVDDLIATHLPVLLSTASAVSGDWARIQASPSLSTAQLAPSAV